MSVQGFTRTSVEVITSAHKPTRVLSMVSGLGLGIQYERLNAWGMVPEVRSKLLELKLRVIISKMVVGS